MHPPIKGIALDILYDSQHFASQTRDGLSDSRFVQHLKKHKLLLMTSLHYGIGQATTEIKELQEKSARTHKLASEFAKKYSDWPGIIVKGCSTARMYEHNLGRVVADVDLLTTKSSAVEFYNYLRKTGCSIIPAGGNDKDRYNGDREYLVDKLMHFHEMPPLLTPDGLIVDLNFRAAYRGTQNYRQEFAIDAIENFFESVLSPVSRLEKCFENPLHELLYLCVHYACEVYLYSFEETGPNVPDIRLFKILDVAMLLRRQDNEIGEFLKVIRQASAEKPCALMFGILVDLFDIDAAKRLLIDLGIDGSELSETYLSIEGSKKSWNATPSQRIEYDFYS